MNLQIGNVYHGFKLLRQEEVKELNSIARIFIHEKSGAQLLDLVNDDSNKVFSIGFKTPPQDDTGVAHILEHSVLCGSRKFPTKEPFVELIKGSLNTFLNAMTFSDKTIYPLASKNEKDFYNLMDVYLDAVFYPNIYNTKEIMMQEGWHYELENPDDALTYKGVVYNEMKGAFSSPEGVLMRGIQKSLFPHNTYGFESGGDPDFIPELTQEKFLAFHSRYYHPSNSYIFLYGDGNHDEMLKFINDNYLQNFDKRDIDSNIQKEAPFTAMKEVEDCYSVSAEDSVKDKALMSLNFVTGDSLDEELYLSMSTLEYLLLETQGAPLKQALLDADMGTDIYGSYDNSILQPVFSIIAKNTDADKREKFKEVVFTTLKDLVENGIDKKLIEACVNITEFKLREADFQSLPKGLYYYMTAMDSWLHDGDPLVHLRYEKGIEVMRRGLTDKYFEKLIEKYLLNNNHSSIYILKPEKGLADRKEKELMVKLDSYKKGLSKEQLNQIVVDTKALLERQVTPDTEEVLKTIPLLSINDIGEKVEELKIKESQYKGIKFLNHPCFTSKIAYITLMFDSSCVTPEEVPYLSLLTTLLGKVNTKNYSYTELSNEMLINTGGIYFKSEVYGDSEDPLKYKTFIEGHCSVVLDKISDGMDILSEIMSNTLFDDKKRIRDLTRILISRIEMKLMDRGHQVATMRLGSYFSPAYAYIERTSGYDFYTVLKRFEENFDNDIDKVTDIFKSIIGKVFNQNNLTVAVTGEEAELDGVKNNINRITDSLNIGECSHYKYEFCEEKKNEGMMTPAHVQYVAKGYNYRKLGYSYTGKMLVLKTILGLDYLWNKVRVQGGAYGAFANVIRSGNFMFASYRDPNITETLKTYDEAAQYLRDFNTTDREMTKYIIGTISELDLPMTPSMAGDTALSNYMRGLTKEAREEERKDVLSTKVEDIREFSKMVEDLMAQNCIVVLGNEGNIKKNSGIFKDIVNVLN